MVVFRGLFTVSMCLLAGVTLQLPLATHAATVEISDPNKRLGEAIAQTFFETHGDDISIVTTRHGASCVASRKLRILDSSYTGPAGVDVPFSNITRSPATSIQAIVRPEDPIAFRVQMKYSPDRTKPIELTVKTGQLSRTIDLSDALESSGDSLLLEGHVARTLTEALQHDTGPVLQATSRDTGHLVADRIAAPDMTGLEACLDMLKELQVQNQPVATAADRDALDPARPNTDASAEFTPIDEAAVKPEPASTEPSMRQKPEETEDGRPRPSLPTPVTGIRVEFVARPDPEARIFPEKIADCRMRDIPETVFLGRLTDVTGFFSQTQDVYVAFDDQGKVQRAYIPGIFDSDLSSTQGRARVSLAADSNLPDQSNTVSGCLGDAPLEAPVCVVSKEDDRYSLAECGVLGMRETRDDFLPFDPDPIVTRINGKSITTTIFEQTGTNTPSLKIPVILPRLNGPGGGNPVPFPPGSPPDDPVSSEFNAPLPPVPLPAAFWMLVGSLGCLLLLRSKAQSKTCRPTV